MSKMLDFLRAVLRPVVEPLPVVAAKKAARSAIAVSEQVVSDMASLVRSNGGDEEPDSEVMRVIDLIKKELSS